MAKNYNGSPGGSDAATIKPKFIPDYQLLGRDDSGGLGYEPYNAQFGDGPFKQGPKAHLSASGGEVEPLAGDERSQEKRMSSDKDNQTKPVPARSVADAKD